MVGRLLDEIRNRVCRLLCQRDELARPTDARATSPGGAPAEPRWHRAGDAWRPDDELEATDRRPAGDPGPTEPRWNPAGDAWLDDDDDDGK